MASRDKKLSISRKQSSASPIPPTTPTESPMVSIPQSDTTTELLKTSTPKTLTVKNPTRKTVGRLVAKKGLQMNLKPRRDRKISQRLARVLINNAKNSLDAKKAMLLNKAIKPVLRKAKTQMKTKTSEEDPSPTLEPILPLENDKKTRKTRVKKTPIEDVKKKDESASLSSIDQTINSILSQITEETKLKKPKRKSKCDSTSPDSVKETIEDVISDLTSLISGGDQWTDTQTISPQMKKDTDDVKTEGIKPKRNIRKKIEPLKNVDNAKLIDFLDLNVESTKVINPVARRHSIEKFTINNSDNGGVVTVFSNLSRGTPRKRGRTSVETLKRLSPYTTRSETPTRVLRNGKHRKLRDNLLDGLDNEFRKRPRLCSDFSGSEKSVSKLSGYESDSSFSDIASLPGPEQNETKEPTLVETPMETEPKPPEIKRSLSLEETNGIDAPNLIDSNSNFCTDEKEDNTKMASSKFKEIEEPCIGTPSAKVPDKPFILDIMKQVFNDVNPDDEKRSTRSKRLHDPNLTQIKMEPTENVEDLNQVKEERGRNVYDDKKGLKIQETPEELAIKENILQALGLQSLRAAELAKLKNKEKISPKSDYTGTLKTVIKVNRCEKKKGRNSLKLTLQKNRGKNTKDGDNGGFDLDQRHSRDVGSSWRTQLGQSSDTAGAIRKSHYSNRSNLDGSSEHTSDGDAPSPDGEKKETLVIPEKASSFGIHPGRLCKDECSYCFGKFGLFDTPCHLAQMKNEETQNKILSYEKYLTKDSCLCDACYRHVTRKPNNSFPDKLPKRNLAPGPRENHCHFLGCNAIASNILRRKWVIRMRKNFSDLINIDLDNPGLHSIPICAEHHKTIEQLMQCVICKIRPSRNHIYYPGAKMKEVKEALNRIGVTITVMEKSAVCRFCRYFASLLLKPESSRPEKSLEFFKQYRLRLLQINKVDVGDEEEEQKDIEEKPVVKKCKRKSGAKSPPVLEPQIQIHKPPSETTSTEKSRSQSPSDYMFDYQTLVPNIALECDSDNRRERSLLKTLHRPDSIKEAVQISKNTSMRNRNSIQRLGSNPSISVRQLFPGEEHLGLHGNIELNNVKERTPEGWEKCISTIQYDYETKALWQELQKPYGNQSSFLRHLILLERYFRNGDLILAPNASHQSINYTESVRNRLRAFDNLPNLPPPPTQHLSVKKSSSGIITTKDNNLMINAANIPKNTPITMSQIKSMSPLKAKNPPGLISLHAAPMRPSYKPPPQKIKIPLTKNWRPTLIPIDSSKGEDRKPGFVKVISSGKPYHITLDDYNRMCAIKKSYDLKQKRLQEEARQLHNGLKGSGRKILPKPSATNKLDTILKDSGDYENSLEKLDKAVEKLEMNLTDLPKIPKSLTVIPQTVPRRPSDCANKS